MRLVLNKLSGFFVYAGLFGWITLALLGHYDAAGWSMVVCVFSCLVYIVTD